MPPESCSPPACALLLLDSRIHRTRASRLDASYVAASLEHTPTGLPVLLVPRFRPSEVRPALMVLYRKYMPRVARQLPACDWQAGTRYLWGDSTNPWRHTRPRGRPRQSGLKQDKLRNGERNLHMILWARSILQRGCPVASGCLG